MAKKDPPKTPPAKKGSAKGVKTPVRGIHHDVSAREERRKEMNRKRNVKHRKQKSDEKKAKEKHQRQVREANKHTKNHVIMAKFKPVRVEKADPKNSKMIVVPPHVGNLEDAEIINFMVWMDMYFQQENKPEHMMRLFSTYSAIEEADGKKEKYVSCRALNQQRVEICIGENCGSSLWLQKNTAFKILVDEVINFYMECHVHGEISNRMPVSFNVVKRTMLNYFESMALKSGLVNQYTKLLNCTLILHLKGTLQQAVHKDLMEPHVQIGGVLTKGALPIGICGDWGESGKR
jgi:hypothetical protein